MFPIVTPMIQAKPAGQVKPPETESGVRGLFAQVLANAQAEAPPLPAAAAPVSLPTLWLGLVQPTEAEAQADPGGAPGEGEVAEAGEEPEARPAATQPEVKGEQPELAALSQGAVVQPVVSQPASVATEAPVEPEPQPLALTVQADEGLAEPPQPQQPEVAADGPAAPGAEGLPPTEVAPQAKGPSFQEFLQLISRQVEAGEAERAQVTVEAETAQGQAKPQGEEPGATAAALAPAATTPRPVSPQPVQAFAETLAGVAEPPEPLPLTEQVIRSVKVTVEQGQSEMRLQLRPRHLGELGIQLQMVEGNLRAELTVANTQVQQALEANLQQLRDSLAAAGIRVQAFTVTVGQQGLGDAPQDRRQPGRGDLPKGQTLAGAAIEEGEAEEVALPLRALRRLNLQA